MSVFPGPPPTSEDDLTLRRLLYSQRQAGQPISAQYLPLGARTERLAARADRAARADLPQLTRQQKRVHISTQSESADTAATRAVLPRAARRAAASACMHASTAGPPQNERYVRKCINASKFWWIFGK